MSGLSAPRIVFGVHSISPYSRADKTPYGILKVIGSASLTLTSSVDQLYGGAQRFAWAAETKTISTDMTAKVKAYPGFLFQLFLGGTVTDNNAEASGSVTSLTNLKGTSVLQATTGIASVGLKSGASARVKFGSFLIVAATTTTVDIYAFSDVDFARGTADAYTGDALKIAAGVTVTASTATEIGHTGIEFTGGSGTVGMTAGDSAYYYSRPINTGSSDITIGKASSSLPAFGAVLLAQKRATAEMFEIEAFNVIGSGMPIPMNEFAFSETELKMTCLYDSVQDAVFKIRSVIPTTFT